MKIILDLDSQQIHYLKAFISRELNDINKNEDHEEYFEEYKKQLKDIAKQLK